MYEYNIYLGYQRSWGGFPHLGTLKYPYHLQKGDVIIVANEIFEAIDQVAKDVLKDYLRYNQQYRIASIHHTIDFKSPIPDIYLVTEKDYLDKFNDSISIITQVEKMLEISSINRETQLQILKGLDDLTHVKSKEETDSKARKLLDVLNKTKEDTETVSAIIPYVKEISNQLMKMWGLGQ